MGLGYSGLGVGACQMRDETMPPSSPVAAALNATSENIAALHNAITHLESRLSPILSPDNTKCSEASPIPGAVSQIVGQIEGACMGVSSAVYRIEAVMNRLTV